MRNPIPIISAALLLGIALTAKAVSDPPQYLNKATAEFDHAGALQYSQDALGNSVGEYSFRNRKGETIKLSDFHGKPLVISLIYTSCYHTCPIITKQLERVVEIAHEALGEDSFSVATIGFDTQADTPARMRSYAREQGIDAPHWWFLSSDTTTIERLSKDLGFIFFPSPRGFDHLAQTTITDAQGRVYRQVYGEMLNSPNFVEPLKELAWGLKADPTTLSGWLNGVRLFCTIYDPSTGRYQFDYSIFIALAVGVLSLGSIAVFIVHAWRQSSPRRSS